MLNRVVIMGRLARDPELRRTANGTAVISFTIACDRDFKNAATGDRETDWIDVVAWRNTAEFVSRYFSKGRMAIVEGRLQTRNWNDRDGNKRVAVEVVADNVYFGDSRTNGAPANDYTSAPAYAAPASNYSAPTSNPSGFAELDDEDGELPF